MSKHQIVRYEYRESRQFLNIGELSRFAGLHPMMIQRLFRLGLIDPQIEEPELLFEDTVLFRIGTIMRMKNDLGLNFAGCGLVLDLLEKVEKLERQLLYYERKQQK